VLILNKNQRIVGMPGIKVQTKTGSAAQAGEYTLQPISRSVSWIGRQAGVVWNRPLAIRVERRGAVQEIPIRDVTLIALVVLWGLTAFFGLYTIKTFTRKRSKTNE
jgi:hypothetical protein